MRIAPLALALAFGLAAPAAQVPGRDAAAVAPAGTATVSGIVLTGEAPGQPVRRATVSLQSAVLSAPISAVTGDDGRFELAGVAAGQYLVRASRPGYVDTVLGAEPGGILGSPIAVADGERLTGVTIHMPRGSVITGVVRGGNGRPARAAQVMVSPIRTVNGERRTRLAIGLGVARTDDRGVYRQFGLPPGEYVVQVLGDMNPLGGSDSLRRTSSDEVAWAERVASASSSGAISPTLARGAPPQARVETLAPIYYPGTPDLSAAQVIRLGVAEERSGIDLVMTYVPTARVTGTVRAPDGTPQSGATVRLLTDTEAQSPADLVGAMFGRGMTVSDDTGAFVIDEVAPGSYTLAVQATRPNTDAPEAEASAPNLMAMVQTIFGRGGANALHATAPVTVAGADVAGIELRLADGATISGRVVFEGATERPSTSMMQVMLAGVSDSTSTMEQALSMVSGASSPVADDLTFAIRGVAPDRYRLAINMPGTMFGALMPMQQTPTAPTWTLKSVHAADGTDLADTPFLVEAGRDVEGVVVTLTDRPAVLSGTVMDARGNPVSAFPIIVFSTDERHWTAGSRRVQQARPASDGTYRIAGLPAGEYYVGAVTALELDDLLDPTFLRQIAPIAFTITIADGEAKEQDLRVGG